MHSINGTNITLTRGDTLMVQLSLERNGETYTPQQGDSIRFAMKRKYTDDDSTALVKTVPTDTLVLEIEPDDTKELPMNKKYVYDIQLTDAQGHVDTFVGGTFELTNEVL